MTTESPTTCGAAVRSSDLFGAWWEIPHPGTLEKLKCATFNEAMDKWFEGFNIPVLVVDGVREDFSKACDRVRRYHAAPNSKVMSVMGRKGGQVRGLSKARTSEQARAAVMVRWNKVKKDKEQPPAD